MKRVALSLLLFVAISVAALAMPQQQADQKSELSARTPQQKLIQLTADNQQRDGNIFHCKGHVEVRITPIHPDEDRIVIHADEVIYHSDTGEIETRGDAKMTIEKAK